MDEATKSVYLQRAAQEKEAAAASLSAYNSQVTDKQSMLINLLSKVKRISAGHANRRILNQQERDLFSSLPQEPPRSAYQVYMKERMGQLPMQGKTLAECRERVKAIAQEWKDLPQPEKQRFESRLRQLKQEFEDQMRKASSQY